MTKEKLIHYQDSYAEAMAQYGLDRGIKGSEARHISTSEHFRNQKEESNNLQIDIALLLQQKEVEQKALEEIKSQKKTEKFKNTATDVVSTIIEGIGSMIGTSKVKKQQKEIENLKEEKDGLLQEVKELKRDMQTQRKEHETAFEKVKQELKKIHDLFPKLKELLWIERLLQVMRFPESLIKNILDMKPVRFKGEIYSPEYKRNFKTEHSVAEIKPHSQKADKLELTIEGVSDTNWFRKKQKEFLEALGITVKSKEESKGIRR